MSTIIRCEDFYRVFVKGAPDIVLRQSTHYLRKDGTRTPLTSETFNRITQKITEFSDLALRTLLICFREDLSLNNAEDVEQDLTVIGLVEIEDPLRPEVIEAIQKGGFSGCGSFSSASVVDADCEGESSCRHCACASVCVRPRAAARGSACDTVKENPQPHTIAPSSIPLAHSIAQGMQTRSAARSSDAADSADSQFRSQSGDARLTPRERWISRPPELHPSIHPSFLPSIRRR
jgi:hypothetical protein